MIIEKNPIFQQAYFVNSIDESAKKWSDLYGAGPFVFTHHHKTDKFEYRNTSDEADVSYAFGYLGDTMIQFIEQHDETPSIYKDMFKKGVWMNLISIITITLMVYYVLPYIFEMANELLPVN